MAKKNDTLRTGSYVKYLLHLKKITLKNLSSPKPLEKLESNDEEKFAKIIKNISY